MAGNSDSVAASETMATSMMQNCAHSAGHPNRSARHFCDDTLVAIIQHHRVGTERKLWTSDAEAVTCVFRAKAVRFVLLMCNKRFFVTTSVKRQMQSGKMSVQLIISDFR